MFTITETRRRLTTLSKTFRTHERVAPNSPVEVQIRERPVIGRPDTPDLPGDDLADMTTVAAAAHTDHVRTPGAIVHLALYQLHPTWGQELVDVQRAWVGTDDEPPQMLWRRR